MKVQKILIGGWFQRTTLHLSEIYDFLKEAKSPLDFDKKKLKELKDSLNLRGVDMKVDNLEHIDVSSSDGLSYKIYEDGLIIFSTRSQHIDRSLTKLTSYYEEKLGPALSYIFSLGAPVPKELASIKNIYPYFVILDKSKEKDIKDLFKEFGQKKYFEIKQESFEIYRGNKFYIINNIDEKLKSIEKFIEEQVFFREFKGQLHRYLNLHRIIWEKIDEVKERGKIRGTEIAGFKEKLESYKKTINLIEARIEQMGAYIGTRASILLNNKELENFQGVDQFKHEKLTNTLGYVKVIWQMTKNYVDSGLKIFDDLAAQSTGKSINDLAVITSMGVGASLIRLFTGQPPTFTWSGVIYFLVLAAIGYTVNKTMKLIYQRRDYTVSDVKIAKNIK
ncbi:hypothetical protein GF382_02510 [Candidatus Falkowbacteria bacterium]|nr:hypothetical protein [Candidatus Falkowbacteria bacterium]